MTEPKGTVDIPPTMIAKMVSMRTRVTVMTDEFRFRGRVGARVIVNMRDQMAVLMGEMEEIVQSLDDLLDDHAEAA